MADNSASLSYREPDIITILKQSGFLLALNVVSSALDHLIYCGLVGQLFVGIAWGVPGANWLDQDVQIVIQQLGYLGLILLVYEGGLSTSFVAMKANFLLCVLVAVTGIAVPIGFSFALLSLVNATPLQSFAAGAALCSTSLGTTFTILSTTGLAKTRLGVVLTGAAMMDDVVGLVMVQIITNLGGGDSRSFNVTTIVRPIAVSIGFALVLLVICWAGVRPLASRVATAFQSFAILRSLNFLFLLHTAILLGFVTGATYAGTSNLFVSYLAGATISWFDETLSHISQNPGDHPREGPERNDRQDTNRRLGSRTNPVRTSLELSQGVAGSCTDQPSTAIEIRENIPTGSAVYDHFYRAPVNRILKPLFFASIGFSIPITNMFRGEIVWRAVIFTILMVLGKCVTGIWLIRLSIPVSFISMIKDTSVVRLACHAAFWKRKKYPTKKETPEGLDPPTGEAPREQEGRSRTQERSGGSEGILQANATENAIRAPADDANSRSASTTNRLPAKPRSLYPAAILGLAMVSRGEIGFLIASIAESNGVFTLHGPQGGASFGDLYLVVIWAITLCTIIGPISVGGLVRRVKALQRQRSQSSDGLDPLGAWGVS